MPNGQIVSFSTHIFKAHTPLPHSITNIHGEGTGSIPALLFALGVTAPEIEKEYDAIQLEKQLKRLKKQRPIDQVVGLVSAVTTEISEIVSLLSKLPAINIVSSILQLRTASNLLEKSIKSPLEFIFNHDALLEENKTLEYWLKSKVFLALGNPNATFADLYKKKKNRLQVKITSHQKERILGFNTTPEFPLWKAIYLSICEAKKPINNFKQSCQEMLLLNKLMDENNKKLLAICRREVHELQEERAAVLTLLKEKPKYIRYLSHKSKFRKGGLTKAEEKFLNKALSRLTESQSDLTEINISSVRNHYTQLIKEKKATLDTIEKEVAKIKNEHDYHDDNMTQSKTFNQLAELHNKLTVSLQDKLGIFFKCMFFLKNHSKSRIIAGTTIYLQKILNLIGVWDYLYGNAEKTLILRRHCQELLNDYEKNTPRIDAKAVDEIQQLFENLNTKSANDILTFIKHKQRREIEQTSSLTHFSIQQKPAPILSQAFKHMHHPRKKTSSSATRPNRFPKPKPTWSI